MTIWADCPSCGQRLLARAGADGIVRVASHRIVHFGCTGNECLGPNKSAVNVEIEDARFAAAVVSDDLGEDDPVLFVTRTGRLDRNLAEAKLWTKHQISNMRYPPYTVLAVVAEALEPVSEVIVTRKRLPQC